jgi:hypothetical protein
MRQQRAIELSGLPPPEGVVPVIAAVARDPLLDLYAVTLRVVGCQLTVCTAVPCRTRRAAETETRRVLRELGYRGRIRWEYRDEPV